MKQTLLGGICVACLLLSGCEMIDYHPYDVRIDGETDINAHHIEQIERDCLGKDTIRFVVHPTFRVIRQSCSAKSLSSKYRSSLNP